MIDNRAFKNGKLLLVGPFKTWFVKWHNCEYQELTVKIRKETFYGGPRYEALDDGDR